MSRGQLELIKELGIEPRTMIDAGAGLPETEAWLAATLWPGIITYGFEPQPKRYADLIAAGYPGTLFKWALGNGSSMRNLYILNEEDLNSGVYSDDIPLSQSVPCTVARLDDILEDHAPSLSLPYLLWLDIEGAEKDALLGAPKTLMGTAAVVVEVWPESQARGWCMDREVAAILTAAGFTKAKEYSWVDDPQRDEVWIR